MMRYCPLLSTARQYTGEWWPLTVVRCLSDLASRWLVGVPLRPGRRWLPSLPRTSSTREGRDEMRGRSSDGNPSLAAPTLGFRSFVEN